jgi:hypothetical protein
MKQKMGQGEQISFTALSVAINVPIFMVSTSGSVAADTRPQTDNGCGLHVRQYFFFTSYRTPKIQVL